MSCQRRHGEGRTFRRLIPAVAVLSASCIGFADFADASQGLVPAVDMTGPASVHSLLRTAQTKDESERPPERRPGVRRPGREVPSPEPPTTKPPPETPLTEPPPAEPSAAEAVPTPTREPLPEADLGNLGALLPVPDRWRIVDELGYPRNVFDPYSTGNILKGDRPFRGDWFFNLGIISDTVIEPRNIPTPVGIATTANPNSLDTFGDGAQLFMSETLALEFVVYRGDTVFRPPDMEFRFIPVVNYNRLRTEELGVVKVDPTEGDDRTETFVGIQTLFADLHLRNVSDRYDFDSVRFGIQPFTADFRGFLFLDQPFGVRLFGTRSNNRIQYNLAWFRRLEKDINSGLNDMSEGTRKDDVFVANLYWQDVPHFGFTSQITILHNRNREGDEIRYDENGLLSRPSSLFDERGKDYEVTYLGYNGDGHFKRINLSGSAYYGFGKEWLTEAPRIETDISTFFGAIEASVDFDWIRLRFSGLYGSGDSDPFDDKAEGFDAIFENPQIAGADTSYWIRQAIPLIGGGGVALSQRNGVLATLRSSKEQGQANFTNPGILLLGIGADFDILPSLRLSTNVNQLWFNETGVLEVLRQQANIDEEIGTDISLALTYRPLLSQNIVLRLSGAALLPGEGYKQLYSDDTTPYSTLANIILAY